MVSPHYIMVCEGGSEDRTTNLVSLFRVIEKVTMHAVSAEKAASEKIRPAQFAFRVVSAWRLQPEDRRDGSFECELFFHIPPEGRLVAVGKAELEYKGGDFVRFTFDVSGTPPADGAGWLQIETRMRRCGDEIWNSQSFFVLVEVAQSPLNGLAG
jgi:hypothetical protein